MLLLKVKFIQLSLERGGCLNKTAVLDLHSILVSTLVVINSWKNLMKCRLTI